MFHIENQYTQWKDIECSEYINMHTKKIKTNLEEITMQYYHKNEKCSFSVEDEYDFTSHHDEINTAYFLYHLFGGHMVVLKESNALYQKTPDFLWNGKFWECKQFLVKNLLIVQSEVLYNKLKIILEVLF